MSATTGAGARWRNNGLNPFKTLDDLHGALIKKGYVFSYQIVYLCLIARRSDTIKGKRHLHLGPVKITKAKNDLRNRHQDANVTFTTRQQSNI